MEGTFLAKGGFRGLWVAENGEDLAEIMDRSWTQGAQAMHAQEGRGRPK